MGKLVSLTRRSGVAGQVGFDVVTDHDGEQSTLGFVGNTAGGPGPVVMILPSGYQTFVNDPGRFGETFGQDWVKRFVEAA